MKKLILVLVVAFGMIATSCNKEVITPNNTETVATMDSDSVVTVNEMTKGKGSKDGVIVVDVRSYAYGTWRTSYRENKFANSTQWVADNSNNENLTWTIDETHFNGYTYTWDQSHNTFNVYFIGDYAIMNIDIVNGRMQLYTMLSNGSSSRFTLERI